MAGLLSFLSDIGVQAGGQPSLTGPLSSLSKGLFGLSNLRYPSDLSSSDKNHYMTITIYEQRNTQFVNDPALDASGKQALSGAFGYDASSAAVRGAAGEAGQALVGIVNKTLDFASEGAKFLGINKDSVDSVAAGAQTLTGYANDTFGRAGDPMGLRATGKITTTISLYMPDTLVFDHHQGYSDVSMGGELLTGLAAGGKSIADIVNDTGSGDKFKQAVTNLSPFALSILANKSGGFGKTLFTAATGVVQNPMLEMIYTSPKFREFRFDFQLYPRSQKESEEVQNIIRELRFHQAPEGLAVSNGFFMVPPSEFGINFYYNGVENPNIPKIGLCVLDSLTVDYAPSGFSAYEVPGQITPQRGGTGMPVAIRLSLNFKETEIRTKASYDREDGLNRARGRTPTQEELNNMDIGFGPGKFMPD
jgi:hypothetical protein